MAEGLCPPHLVPIPLLQVMVVVVAVVVVVALMPLHVPPSPLRAAVGDVGVLLALSLNLRLLPVLHADLAVNVGAAAAGAAACPLQAGVVPTAPPQ